MELCALAEAFEGEQNKLEANKKHLHHTKQTLMERKRKMKKQRIVLNDVAKSLVKLEKALVLKLHEVESLTKVNISKNSPCVPELHCIYVVREAMKSFC